jgi:hypothetical protein
MKKMVIWIIAGAISYAITNPIKNLFLNLIASTILFIVIARYLDKWMEGDI